MSTDDIAIIGLSLKFPKSNSLSEFWRNLQSGLSLITEVPEQRWDKNQYKGDPRREPNKTSSIWGGFVEDADCFDAEFFNISPREAQSMDPQQRFALELAWQALEDANYLPSRLATSNTGVYMGVCHWDYAELFEKTGQTLDAYFPTGTAYSIIANRISHFFDFSGPSITNDTACASSLVSIQQAMRALQSGECELALAGGVNLIWSVNHFIAFSKNGMLSRDGLCKTFDQKADGYVRGEGGAILVLKPMQTALRDGDLIHAVIKGAGTNHGGRTSSLTVTNPAAQAQLISQIYSNANIDVQSVSYIETHGPGTPLGDPVEIFGLKKAFEQMHQQQGVADAGNYCGLGSVKTNIGHLEGAAGVAGVIKVIAAMQQQHLPSNVNFTALNPRIKLDDSPFYIVDQCKPWNPTHPLSGVAVKRRAGVSSFGFGGTNAHVLLEEYDVPVTQQAASVTMADGTPQLAWVPISAKTPEQLHAQVQQLNQYLEQNPGTNLHALAYTLQHGREAMAARLIFQVSSLLELRNGFEAYLAGREPVARMWVGQTDSADVMNQVTAPRLSDSLSHLDPVSSAQAWTQGQRIVWENLSTPDLTPNWLRLPGYPFAKVRHWMPETPAKEIISTVLHPLLHKNVSTLDHCVFTSQFSGQEYFLKDHMIAGASVLPGVAYLEMVRAAVEQASDIHGAVVLKNVVWLRPWQMASSGSAITVRLEKHAQSGITFEIFSRTSPESLEQVVHAQGMVRIEQNTHPHTSLDLDALLRSTGAQAIPVNDCYAQLTRSGVALGERMRAMTDVFATQDIALVRLSLSAGLEAGAHQFALHPALLDSAIQATMAISQQRHQIASGPSIPFALRELQMNQPCEGSLWAYVRRLGQTDASGTMSNYDIDLCNQAGAICVQLKGLSLRTKIDTLTPLDSALPRLTLKTPQWLPMQRVTVPGAQAETPLILAIHATDTARIKLLESTYGETLRLIRIHDQLPTADRLKQASFDILDAMQSAFARQGKNRLLVILPDTWAGQLLTPLSAMLKSCHEESACVQASLLRVAGLDRYTPEKFIELVQAERNQTETEVRIDAQGVRTVLRFVEPAQHTQSLTQPLSGVAALPIREGGVYWLTGGLGGIGQLLCRELSQTPGVKLIVTGRSGLLEQEPVLQRLSADGIEVEYLQADVSVRTDVERIVLHVQNKYGSLHGLLHCAGVLRDAYILKKTHAQIAEVFAPKVTGTLNLDAATQDFSLDFFLLFSSVAGAYGGAGQADYAVANAFLNAYSAYRQHQVDEGMRSGHTLSICWPLWESGGMHIEATTLDAMKKRTGMRPLPSAEAFKSMRQAFALSGQTQVVVNYSIAADTPATPPQSVRMDVQQPVIETVRVQQQPSDDSGLLDAMIDRVRKILGEVLRIDSKKIRATEKFEQYGFDSIMAVEMINQLEDLLGSLPKTLFFEYVDIQGVATYLVAEHRDAVRAALGVNESISTPVVLEPSIARVSELILQDKSSSLHDIAVIGVAGRYPHAETMDEFWQILSQGKHCFEPIPKDRWDHDAIYSSDSDELGKTTIQNGSFLQDIDKFDPRYFNISQREAELMSPEVRMFLQVGVEAFEDAGYSKEHMQRTIDGDVGVLVGTMSNHYGLYGFQNMLAGGSRSSGSYTGTLPNMLSYFYGFSGPSIFMDTMCSASSTCIDQAVHMLRSKQCKMVLAGGVNLLLHPYNFISSSQEHFTTKTAKLIRSFGLGADGTILGEGLGAVVLKPLADAQRDGDHIHMVIKGTAINNAGIRNGFTVPSPTMQAKVVRKAIEDAQIDPRTISYVEAHGSGTKLGDPIEIKALTQTYQAYTQAQQFCPIGSVKSNIAHLLAAAGIAGFTKVLLQLKHKKIVPSLHSEVLNPAIPFEQSPFFVPQSMMEWKQPEITENGFSKVYPRRAGITSIGAGGMNSHIIVEEYQALTAAAVDSGQARLFIFSGMHLRALRRYLQRFVHYFHSNPAENLDQVSYTLQVGRNTLPCRLALIAHDVSELVELMHHVIDAGSEEHIGLAGRLWFISSVLASDEEPDPVVVNQHLLDAHLPGVAHAWINGASVPWELLWPTGTPQKLSMPNYPFDKVRCWYDVNPDAPTVLHPGLARNSAEPSRTLAQTQETPIASVKSSALLTARVVAVSDTQAIDDKQQAFDALALAVRTKVAELMKFSVDQIDLRDTFYSFGFNSISMIELARDLSTALGVELSPALFFEAESLAHLVRYLAEHHAVSLPVAQVLQEQPNPQVSNTSAVAVIGMACKFPGAKGLDEFWDLLAQAHNAVKAIPAQRYGQAYRKKFEESRFPKIAGVLDGIEEFDAEFFNISPAEAELMDPQHRLFLQTAWHALENAAYVPERLPAHTGVFVGVSGNDYLSLLNAHDVAVDAYTATGNSHAMLANRLSYFLGLHGPSQAVDTACSSSLVALHHAIEHIRHGHAEMAIAGGVNIALSADSFLGPELAGMLSPEGQCKTFSATANGYVRGEGVGVLILKSLEHAQRDGDPILAVLAGSAENHGGRANSLTAPNARAQTEVVLQAMQGIDPGSVQYIEAHGTGTALGDPVEIRALSAAYGQLAASRGMSLAAGSCAVGSVKTNIGHLEAAAGIAGVIKVILAMQHQSIPKSLHAEVLNPYIDFNQGPFYAATQAIPWSSPLDINFVAQPRTAGVSSFGFGGSNVHVVVREYISSVLHDDRPLPGERLIVLSALNQERLDEHVIALHAWATRNIQRTDTDQLLSQIAYTLQAGRAGLPERLAFIVSSFEQMIQTLEALRDGRQVAGVQRARVSHTRRDDQASLVVDTLAQAQQHWLAGVPVQWDVFYTPCVPQRIALPGYCFARHPYWIPGVNTLFTTAPIEPEYTNTIGDGATGDRDRDPLDQLLDQLMADAVSIDEAERIILSASGRDFTATSRDRDE
jgi:polyketide synthase PksL